MAGLTSNGLQIKSLTEIISQLQTAIRAQLGNDIDLSENSALGILTRILSAEVADEWELAQAVYDAFGVNTATGKQLDDLAALLRITRLEATKTTGNLALFGDSGTVVPVGTLFSDTLGNVYENTEEGSLDLGTSRTPVNISPQGGGGVVGSPSTTYSLTVNGDVYTYQTLWPETNADLIASKIAEQVPDNLDYSVETRAEGNPNFVSQIIPFFEPIISSNVNSNTFLNVINKDENNAITVSVLMTNSPTPNHESANTPFMGVGAKIPTYTDIVAVEAQQTGAILTAANTLVNIDTPVSGLDSVTNPSELIIGRALETDEELRKRFKESSAINGNATPPSIEDKLNQVDGVTKAFIVENRTLAVDIQGRPAKSYECVVIGGSDTDIANTIWNSKPAGIETFGTESVQIQDSNGRFHIVNFSRAASIFVWVKVYYTKFSEELFPTNGETLITDAVVTAGNNLELGEDVIPKRFYGSIYASTQGIENLRVLMATSVDPMVEPSLSQFLDVTIAIEDNEIANFVDTRIEVIEE